MGNGAYSSSTGGMQSALILFKIPNTKRVDHKRAVKMYERAAGDKTLPSDLRPPIVLKVCLHSVSIPFPSKPLYRKLWTTSSMNCFLERVSLGPSTSSVIGLERFATISLCSTRQDRWRLNVTIAVRVSIYSLCISSEIGRDFLLHWKNSSS